jgi:hypothetical protein
MRIQRTSFKLAVLNNNNGFSVYQNDRRRFAGTQWYRVIPGQLGVFSEYQPPVHEDHHFEVPFELSYSMNNDHHSTMAALFIRNVECSLKLYNTNPRYF